MPIPAAQLKHAWLGSVEFHPNPEFDPADARKVSYELDPTSSISEFDRDQEDGALRATVALTVGVSFVRVDSADDETGLPFEMSIETVGLFEWPPTMLPPDEPIARAWLEYNGAYLLWPYARSFVATITALSHLPALTIYTMTVPQPPLIPPPPDEVPELGQARSADAPLDSEHQEP